jgi:triphosphatase
MGTMAATDETEIKLLASPAMLARLQAAGPLAGPVTTTDLRTTYFDCPDRRLAQAGLSLRLRRQDGASEQTAKTRGQAGGAVRRGEWSVPVEGDRPRLDAFPPRIRARLGQALAGAEPVPVAETRITRATRRLHHDQSLIELAFDSGHIAAGDRRETVCEVELERVRGQLRDLLALALTLPLGPDLRWSVLGKGDRGDNLARGTPPAAVQARPVALPPDADLERAFHSVAWNCLDHLLANYPLVLATGDAEAVHQCRVAMRRLLAAWKTFGAHVADDRLPVLRAGIKAVARTLGRARDLHVLQQRCATMAGNATVLAAIAQRQAEATGTAQAALASASFQTLLFEIAWWIEAGPWRDRAAVRQPLEPFARRLLAKALRKLHPGRKPLSAMSPEALHRLRKRGKQVRYAMRFFDDLWDDRGGKRAKVLDALGDLQDHLGEVHDRDAAGEVFTGPAETQVRFGQMLRHDRTSRKQHLRAARKALRKIRKNAPFDAGGGIIARSRALMAGPRPKRAAP